MRTILPWSLGVVLVAGWLCAANWVDAGFPGRPFRRAARTTVPAAPPVAATAEQSVESGSSPGGVVPPSAPDDATLAEILRIRDTQGSVLRGSLLEASPSSPHTFRDALRRIAEPNARDAAADLDKNPLPADIAPRLPSPDSDLIHTLRAASRGLDAKAGDWEEARRFADADRFRKLADQLRQEARALEARAAPAETPY